MNQLSELLDQYHEAVASALLVAPVEERSLYAGHVQEIDRLRVLVSSGSSTDALAPVIAGERRAFGWSYLPGPHGERVESAFHALASFIEHGGRQ